MVTRAQTARDSDRARRAFNSPHARQSKRRERSWIVDKSELDRRVEEEAGKAFERWDHFDGDSRESMPEAVRPLVERIVELETDAAHEDELAKLDGAEMAEMRDKLTAAQTAGRDQASEIERLKVQLIDLNGERNEYQRAAKRCADEAREMRFELEKQTKRADDADDEITDLRTTVRVIVGMIAPRGQS